MLQTRTLFFCARAGGEVSEATGAPRTACASCFVTSRQGSIPAASEGAAEAPETDMKAKRVKREIQRNIGSSLSCRKPAAGIPFLSERSVGGVGEESVSPGSSESDRRPMKSQSIFGAFS